MNRDEANPFTVHARTIELVRSGVVGGVSIGTTLPTLVKGLGEPPERATFKPAGLILKYGPIQYTLTHSTHVNRIAISLDYLDERVGESSLPAAIASELEVYRALAVLTSRDVRRLCPDAVEATHHTIDKSPVLEAAVPGGVILFVPTPDEFVLPDDHDPSFMVSKTAWLWQIIVQASSLTS